MARGAWVDSVRGCTRFGLQTERVYPVGENCPWRIWPMTLTRFLVLLCVFADNVFRLLLWSIIFPHIITFIFFFILSSLLYFPECIFGRTSTTTKKKKSQTFEWCKLDTAVSKKRLHSFILNLERAKANLSWQHVGTGLAHLGRKSFWYKGYETPGTWSVQRYKST